MTQNPLKILADNLDRASLDLSLFDYIKLKANDSLASLYALPDSSPLTSFHHTCLFVPWIHYQPVEKFRAKFSDIFFDEAVFHSECKKMRLLVASIKHKGYLPEEFPTRQGGHITGYYLESEGVRKFFVVSGNHRAAALAHLYPDRTFEAIFDKQEFLKERDLENSILGECYPNTFSGAEIEGWPAVESGFLDKSEALTILESYVHGRS